jgi:DNA modification methylase
MQLWSNPGDLVLSPFAGIGSEGYVSLQMQRRFVGFELKPSYFNCAAKNLQQCEASRQTELV